MNCPECEASPYDGHEQGCPEKGKRPWLRPKPPVEAALGEHEGERCRPFVGA